MRLAALILLCLGGLALGDPGEHSFKGWELYAWSDKGCADGTCFALLTGTNRNKTVEEVRQKPLDLAALEARIGKLATGEDIIWQASSFVVPDAARQRVAAACTKRGVKLSLP